MNVVVGPVWMVLGVVRWVAGWFCWAVVFSVVTGVIVGSVVKRRVARDGGQWDIERNVQDVRRRVEVVVFIVFGLLGMM